MSRFLQPSFSAGELAPSMHSRVDLQKYHAGAKLLRNFFVHKHGGASNRPGTKYVATALGPTRLIPFVYSTSQAYALEFSHLKMRIIKDGGIVTYPPAHPQNGQPVEIVSPYAYADLATLKFVQSADVIFLTHPLYTPKRLSRTDHHLWTFANVSFTPGIAAPAGLAATPTGFTVGTGKIIDYKVAAVSADGEESLPSTSVQVDVNKEWTAGAYVALAWTATSGADQYNVYKSTRGYYGWIGTVDTNAFKDDNVQADTANGPQTSKDPFASPNFPRAVGIFQQRMVYGGSTTEPQTVWTSQTGALNNFGISRPLKDNDAITAMIDSRQINEIRHFVPMDNLIIFTSSSEWIMTHGQNSAALTPTSVNYKLQGTTGCNHVPPLTIRNNILFIEKSGKVVNDFAYTLKEDRYVPNDLSVLAEHLFTTAIKEWAYQQDPYNLIWCVKEDGGLLSLTYMREQELWAWTRHDTAGTFESVCSVPGQEHDDVYFIVNRTMNGQIVRCVEMLADRLPVSKDVKEAFFVDCGLTYRGTPTRTITGLEHLEGMAVSVLADGSVVTGKTVTDGEITLAEAAAVVHVGLGYTCEIETLTPEAPGGETIQGRKKRIVAVTVRMEDTRGYSMGPDADHLTEEKFRSNEVYGAPTELFTGDKRLYINPNWSTGASIFIRQTSPLPVSVLALIPEVEVGT